MRQTTTILLFSIFSMLNGQNIVHNSGFEDDLNIFTVIEGSTNVLMRVANIQDATTQTANPTATAIPVAAGLWMKKSPNSGFIKAVVMDTDRYNGDKSLLLRINAGTTQTGLTNWFQNIIQQKTTTALSNTKKYKLSVWAKKDATSPNAADNIYLFLTDNTAKVNITRTLPLTGGTTWTKYESIFDVPGHLISNPTANFSTAYFGVGITTTYTDNKTNYSGVYFDDFLLEEYDVSFSNNRNSSSFLANDNVIIRANGHLTVNNSMTLTSLVAESDARISFNAGTNLNISQAGGLVLRSDVDANATLLDEYSSPSINATVEQYVEAGRNWYIASPVVGASHSVLNRGSSVVAWSEATKTWETVTGSNLMPGKGYIQVANNAQGSTGVVSFSGLTNSGNIIVPLTRTETGTSRGFNLVGNPYPSYLNWSALIADADNADIETTMWYRTKNLLGNYTFATHNGLSGLTVTGTATTSITNRIPPMQAFWVRVRSGYQNAQLVFKNYMREHKDVAGNKLKTPGENFRPLLRLELNNSIWTDELLIYAANNASNFYDDYDSGKMLDSAAPIQFYSQVDTHALAINGMEQFLGVHVPLIIKLKNAESNLQIKALAVENFASEIDVVLLDYQTNTEKILEQGSSYSFQSDVKSIDNRFAIHFKAKAQTTALSETETETPLVHITRNKQLEIRNASNVNMSIFNTAGQLLLQKTLKSNSVLLQKKFARGVYIVHFELTNGKQWHSKVIVD